MIAGGRLGLHRHGLDFLGHLLAVAQHLGQVAEASDRLPPDFCWIEITIPKKFASGTGMRSNNREQASPSGMPIACVSMIARNSLFNGSGKSVATTLSDSNSGKPALMPRTITSTASGRARRNSSLRRFLRNPRSQRGTPKPAANARPTAAIGPAPKSLERRNRSGRECRKRSETSPSTMTGPPV